MFKVASLLDFKKWKETKESNMLFVLVTRKFPKGLKKKEFNYWFPELAPSPELRKKQLEMTEKLSASVVTARYLGETTEERALGASILAFKTAYGLNGAFFRRALRRNVEAEKNLATLRELSKKGFTVVLFNEEDRVVNTLYIVIQMLSPYRTLSQMFRAEKASDEHKRFGEEVI